MRLAGLLLLICGVVDAASAGAATKPATVAVEGVLSDADGVPLDAFQFMIFRRQQAPQVVSFDGAEGKLAANADTSIYALAIIAEGKATWFEQVRFASRGTHRIGERTLQRGGVLAGRVTAAESELPIAGVRVDYVPRIVRFQRHLAEAIRALPGWSATTDENGSYTLDRLPEHLCCLDVQAPGFAMSTVAPTPGTVKLDIPLGRGAMIEGLLASTDGVPIAGTVRLVPESANRTRVSQEVDDDGRFRYQHVEPGMYILSAGSNAGVVAHRSVTVDHDDRVVVELVADPLGHVSGWISGLDEAQAASIHVLRDDAARRFVRSSTGGFPNGAFALHGLADGSYVVEAYAGSTALRRKVEIVGGAASVDFDFTSDRARLSGRITGTGPISVILVRAVPVDAALPAGETATDIQGRFVIDGLADGPYRLDVRLGKRGSYRSFDVALDGDTTFDVRLGPHSLAGTLQGGDFKNAVVQARRISPGDEPLVYRDFVDGGNRYFLDGLVEGVYTLSLAWPTEGAREIRVVGDSVQNADFRPTPSPTRRVRVVDTASGQALDSLKCVLEEGTWQGLALDADREGRMELPTTIVDTEMSCAADGYESVRVRWDGSPLIQLEPSGFN